MCTVETATTTVSTSSNETTKYSCQDNAERGWIISCVYAYICVCVHGISEETRVTRERQGSKTAYIHEIRFTLYSLLIEGIEGNTRIFKENIQGEEGWKEGCIMEGGMMVGGFRWWIRVSFPSILSFGNHLRDF